MTVRAWSTATKPRRVGLFVAAICVPAVLSACGTATIDNAVPQSAASLQTPATSEATGAVPEPRPDPAASGVAAVAAVEPVQPTRPANGMMPADARAGAPVNTGTYPNLNIPPKVAAPQLTPAERNDKIGELRAAQKQAQLAGKGDVPNKGDLADMARKGKTHAADTLKAIEGE
jgi:hypothetical protein